MLAAVVIRRQAISRLKRRKIRFGELQNWRHPIGLASACQFSYDVLEWDKLFGESNNKYTETGGDITSRGHLLHHPLHAKAIYDRCHEVGVGVVAQIPGVDIVPGKEDPQSLKEFIFKVLKVENKALRLEKPPSSK